MTKGKIQVDYLKMKGAKGKFNAKAKPKGSKKEGNPLFEELGIKRLD